MSDTITAVTGPTQAVFGAMAEGHPTVYAVQGSTASPAITVDLAALGLTDEVATATLSASLAPDGNHVVYAANVERSAVMLANLADSSLSQLFQAEGEEHLSDFSWKSDGSQLAYLKVDASSSEKDPYVGQIFALTGADGQRTKLYGDDALQLLGWSADGTKLHFTRRANGLFAYTILDVASGNLTDVFLNDHYENEQDLHIIGLTFAGGGQQALLAYVLNASPYLQNCSASPILVVKAEDGQPIQQFRADGAATSLSISPDSSLLAFTLLKFPSGSGQPDAATGDSASQETSSGIGLINLQDGTVKQVVSYKSGVGQYRVLAWGAGNSGLFVTSDDGAVDFYDMDGNSTSIVPPVSTAGAGGLSVGGDAFVSQFGIRGATVNLDTPYIHQVKMTPDDFDGNWACGPSSATMAAAYYKKLAPRNDTFNGYKSEYGWYISTEFASPASGYVFNRRDNDAAGRPAAGAYGHCVQDGSGYAWRIVDYLKRLGLNAVFRETVTMSLIKQYLNANKPIVLSTNIHGFGHIVLLKGYMPDGRLITNDPYWGKPGAGERVYTWGELGTAFWMVTIDDEPPTPNTAPAVTAAPVPAPAPAPVAPPPPAPAPPSPIEPGSGNDGLRSRFRAAYDRNGGSGTLGQPSTRVYSYNDRFIQEFQGGSKGQSVLVVDARHDRPGDQPVPTAQPAFLVGGDFLRAWRDAYGGSSGVLGSPLSDEYQNTQGNRQQSFEGGYLLTENGQTQAYPWPTNFNAWKAEYFNNTGLAGKPTFLRDEQPNATGGLSHDWAANAPENGGLGVMADNFSVRYTRVINFGDGGVYGMAVTVDDGFRLMVDGTNLAAPNPDQYWRVSGPVPYNFRVQVGAGVHTLVFEFLEAGGNALINFDINPE